MHRSRWAIATTLLGGVLSGCGEDQPNPSATPEQVTPDFAAKSADMMKAANTGMDPKQIKKQATPKK